MMVQHWRFCLVFIALLLVAACATGEPKSSEAQALVEKARWTIQTFKERSDLPRDEFLAALRNAKGVVVLPGVVKGGFIVAAEGGSGVLLTRDVTGAWGYPAFYSIGGGSFGLQAGGKASEIVLILRSNDAVKAVVENQGKLGGGIDMALGNFGAGIEGSTTTNLGPDIVGFSYGPGVFAGAALQGAVIFRRNDLNEAYYGHGATPKRIVYDHSFSNAHADALRTALVIN